MIETDLQYYERRRDREVYLASIATSAEAASAHRALGLIYAEEVRRLESSDKSLKPDKHLKIVTPADPRTPPQATPDPSEYPSDIAA